MTLDVISNSRLFLYSLSVTQEQCQALTKLVGKTSEDISIAVIENAADPIPNSSTWLGGFREMLRSNGYRIVRVDLRNWIENNTGLRKTLEAFDVIWLGGGNTYYLRWILMKTGADRIIRELISAGKVYSGWSAGAVVAGPTTKHFEKMGDSISDAPEYISDGLKLTDFVVIPHKDHADFAKDAAAINNILSEEGFRTLLLNDNEAVVIERGSIRRI